ncbi:MAG: DUF5715 family protein, partial [Gemmatimonadaceae bacterium]
MRKGLVSFLVAAGLAITLPLSAYAVGLRGSPGSMKSQHAVAVDEDLAFLRTPEQVTTLVDSGALVRVEGNADFKLSGVSFPYARPEIKLFIERLAAQHHAETGRILVVTSLTRPESLQPKNAHKLSVHPTGMAVDFRVPLDATSRSWLESALLGMESSQLLDVTRERTPAHYHVAVYPAEYLAYAEKQLALELRASTLKDVAEAASVETRSQAANESKVKEADISTVGPMA